MNAFSEMDRARRAFNNPKSGREVKTSLIEKIQNLISKTPKASPKKKEPSRPNQPLERNSIGKDLPKR
jgi:hypothetical protein